MRYLEFHADLGIPDCLIAEFRKMGTILLDYTEHARFAARTDHLGRIDPLPYAINCAKDTIKVVEATYNLDRKLLVKVVVRFPYTTRRDLVLAMLFENGVNVVKTVWTNMKDDDHPTLNRSRYNRPAEFYGELHGSF